MENMHTEKTLKGLNKEQLLAIAAANGIEVTEGTKNDDIKALILEKGCPIANGETKTEEQDGNVPKFTKDQILASKWFTHRRDALSVLLKDDEQYSHAEVDKILGEFLKGKVN